jgi:hypothetical protein
MTAVFEQDQVLKEVRFNREILLSDIGKEHEEDLSRLKTVMCNEKFDLRVKFKLLTSNNTLTNARLYGEFVFLCYYQEGSDQFERLLAEVWSAHAAPIVADYVRKGFPQLIQSGSLTRISFEDGKSGCAFTFCYEK